MSDPATSIQSIIGALQSGDPAQVATSALNSAVRRVTVETQFFPTFSFEPQLDASGQPAAASGVDPLGWLKPKFTVELAFGDPVVFAPRGEPTQNFVPHALGVIALLAAGLAFLKGAKSMVKPVAIAGGALVIAGIAANRVRS